MKEAKAICFIFFWLNLFHSVCSEDHRIQRRSNNVEPALQMTIGHNLNNSMAMKHGSEYGYTFIVKHSAESRSDARGVHVTWMLTPFVKFKKVASSLMMGSLQVQQKDDSVTFLIDRILWAEEVKINFTVIFDNDFSLKNGRHHIVTPVGLLYYKDYTDDGHVITKGASFSSPPQIVTIEINIPGCESALGMASGKIKDYQLTASSTYSYLQPYKARPGGDNDAWCAFITNDQQYIQIDFTKKTRVTRIETYGRSQKQHWVKRYLIQFSNNDMEWYNYTENGFDKEFPGNFDSSTSVSHHLKNEIEAHSIRIRPLAWQKLVCMRFEVFGCPIEGAPENCIDPLGLESGYIPDEGLSHSVDTSQTVSNPTDIRLNKNVPGFPYGWQASLGQLDYLQVDFGSLRKVTRVATQGASSFFVTRFQLKFSNNSIEWLDYTENGIVKELNGPKNGQEAKNPILVKLSEPFTARYVRFIPTSAPVLKVMRAELYGCMAEPLPPFGGVHEYSRRAVLLDPDSGRFYVCMYTEQKSESSCFFSSDGMDWTGLDESIVSIIAFDPTNAALFGVDHKMNFHRSTNDGVTWKVISSQYFYNLKNETSLIMSTGIPENMVTATSSSFWSATSSSGKKWGENKILLYKIKPIFPKLYEVPRNDEQIQCLLPYERLDRSNSQPIFEMINSDDPALLWKQELPTSS